MTNDKADFTQGSILKKLVAFMMPVLGALILQAAYGAVDLLVVGRFGSTSGLSAVSTGSQVLNLVTFVVVQFAMGITVLIARYLGEKKTQQIGAVIGGGAIVFAMISVVLLFVMVCFAHPISVLMQAPAEAVDLTASYVRICGGGIFFIVAYNLLSAIFRGLGDSKSPLLFVLVACIVNVFGDLILVAGLHLDAAGAALATITGQIVGVILAAFFNHTKNHEIDINMKGFRPHGRTIATIYKVGVPSIIMQAITSVMTFGMNKILLMFSSTATAVFGVYFKLQSFIFMPVFGLNNGMIPIVAYNYGSRNKHRIIQTAKFSVAIAVTIMMIGLVLFQTCPRFFLFTLFDASDQMLAIGVPALRIISLSFLFAGYNIIVGSVFQALGNGVYSLIVSLARQLFAILPIAYIFAILFGLHAVWWAIPIAEIVSLITSTILLKRIYRLKIAPL